MNKKGQLLPQSFSLLRRVLLSIVWLCMLPNDLGCYLIRLTRAKFHLATFTVSE